MPDIRDLQGASKGPRRQDSQDSWFYMLQKLQADTEQNEV